MDTLRQDLAYAIRRLRRSPGFTAVAIATLAVGIGANSAIFSVVRAVLLKPLPFDEPERLVRVAQTWQGRPVVYSPQNFLDVEAEARSFEGLSAVVENGMTLTSGGPPARVEGASVSASFFDVLRVRPTPGRGFVRGENDPGRTRVAVLGQRLWSRRFGADPTLVGRTIELDREPYEVVGIAPADFSFPEGVEIWTPLEHDEVFRTKSRGAWYLTVIGRLRPEASIDSARDEVATIAARLARTYPDADEGVGGTVGSLQESLVGDVRPALLVLLGAVGLVLLIACVNVANLLLARVAAREVELAVRTALGAGRLALVRQLLTESLLLAALGGIAGIFLAWLSLDSLLALQPRGVPRLSEVHVDRAVAAFTALVSVVTGLLFGVFPALHSTRRATADTLREGGRGLLGGRAGRLRGGLVIGQMALAMMLLAGAGLLVRSFTQLRRVDPGFRSDGVLTFRISLPESAYAEDARRTAFFDELVARLRALPGVSGAGAVSGLPLGGSRFGFSFEIAGRPPVTPAQQPSIELRIVTADYLKTMGIPLRLGRGIEASDTASAPPVVVLSESAARRYFPGEDPLGQRLKIGMRTSQGSAGGEIVGVVGDVKDGGLAADSLPTAYLPYAQTPFGTLDVLVRTATSPLALLSAAQGVVRELDPELALARVRTLDDVVARSISEPRFYTVLLGAFATIALLLAAIGIFGVLSYAVVQRSREIGIRVALGAHPAQVLGLVLRQALLLSATGVAAGLVGALLLGRALSSLLFQLSPRDPATLACVAGLLVFVALVASYLPARQATRVDPLVALRSE
jgi:putative ABC transport system permease protein